MKKLLKHRTLAEGEVTGHSHQASKGTALFEISDSEISVESLEEWYVSHEEHTRIDVPVHTYTGTPTANYVRRIVQEFDHAAEAVRNIAD